MTHPTKDALERFREQLAELEHVQWIAWSKELASSEQINPLRKARWETLWVPYSELTEEQKDQDRVWADKALAFLAAELEAAREDERKEIIEELETWLTPETLAPGEAVSPEKRTYDLAVQDVITLLGNLTLISPRPDQTP